MATIRQVMAAQERRRQREKKRVRNRPATTAAPRQLDFIGQVTGKERGWWVAFIQGRITARAKRSKDPWHDQSDSQKVMNDVVAEIRRLIYDKAKKEKRAFDSNMALAMGTSYVLAVWYLRLHRAKSYDPRRPVKLRQAAYWHRYAFARAIFDAIVDESQDPKYFPGQRWESPFDPYPTDGYFV